MEILIKSYDKLEFQNKAQLNTCNGLNCVIEFVVIK